MLKGISFKLAAAIAGAMIAGVYLQKAMDKRALRRSVRDYIDADQNGIF